MPLELDVVGTGVTPNAPVIRRMTVANDAQTAIGTAQRQQTVENTGCGANVPSSLLSWRPFLSPPFLGLRSAAGSCVGCGVDP